jgi:hypoxanthine phosphoribosyltransferase
MVNPELKPFPDAVVVATEAEVDQAYRKIADGLQDFVTRDDCVLLTVMIGGMIPAARVAALLKGDFSMDYCQVSRYRNTERGGELIWLQEPRADLIGKTVLLVDDIFDEGLTLEYVANACREKGAARVVTAVLVRKIHDRVKVTDGPDLVGLTVADRYAFGCGMDYKGRWRHMPEIYALRSED